MRILVTGFAGMIGSEITKQLVAAGHTVLGNDDLSHNAVDPRSLLGTRQTFLCGVEQLPLFSVALSELDLIIHCASPVGHARLTPEAEVAWTIIRDTQAILELAERKDARLITFSSSEVLTYKGETDIRSQYALGKLTSEAMALGHRTVDARVVRPYNVVGRLQRADGGFVMPRFRDAALTGQPLTVFGSGEQVRHFTHVSDFARFILLLVEKWPQQKRWCVFNPRNGASINRLAYMFSPQTCVVGRDGREALDNPHWRDSSERPLDMREYRACRELGWEPRVTLTDIVREMLTVEAATHA